MHAFCLAPTVASEALSTGEILHTDDPEESEHAPGMGLQDVKCMMMGKR